MRCPVCYSRNSEQIFDLGPRPLSVSALQPTARESMDLPRYEIRIRVCHSCSHVFNSHFDSDVDQYSGDGCTMYNDGHSWTAHVDDMVRYVNSIDSTLVVEIGPGDGEFLSQINGDVVGYEPSDDCHKCTERGLRCYKKYFEPNTLLEDGSLVVMRHVLEHIHDPTDFLETLAIANENQELDILIEVPCIENALTDCRLEDWTYEHPNHFTESSLRHALERSGWTVAYIFKTYGGEVLVAHATLSNGDRTGTVVKDFQELRVSIDEFRITDQPYVFWGGAGKSTMFLHALARDYDYVVDSDTRKWGKYVPGLSLRIESPSHITSDDIVIITTNWREQDILAEIRLRGLKPAAVYTYKNGELHASQV